MNFRLLVLFVIVAVAAAAAITLIIYRYKYIAIIEATKKQHNMIIDEQNADKIVDKINKSKKKV